MTTETNKLPDLIKMGRLLKYKIMWMSGELDFSEKVVTEINTLMESETIIREEMVKLFVEFGTPMSEAEYVADLRMAEVRDMQAELNLKHMLGRLWTEKYYELEGNV